MERANKPNSVASDAFALKAAIIHLGDLSPGRSSTLPAARNETGRLWLQEGYPVAAWQQLVRAVQLDPDGPIGQEARELMDRVPGVHRRSP